MSRGLREAAIAVAFVLGCAGGGIGIVLMLDGCAAIMAALPDVIAAISDASMILDEIERFVNAYFLTHPDQALQKKVEEAMAHCRSALLAAERTASGAEKLDQAQVDAAFADFKVAYTELLALVGPFGVHSETGVSAAPNELLVPEPTAMHLRVRQ